MSWSAIGRSSSLPRCCVLYGLFFADAFGASAAMPYLSIGSTLGSHAALVVSGAVVTALLTRYRDRGGAPAAFGWYAIGYGALLIAAGWIVHQFRGVDPAFWISKLHATPAWCLISGGITVHGLGHALRARRRQGLASMARRGHHCRPGGAFRLSPGSDAAVGLCSVAALTGGVNVYGVLGDHLAIGHDSFRAVCVARRLAVRPHARAAECSQGCNGQAP